METVKADAKVTLTPDVKVKGVITLTLYDGKPCEAKFEGTITGSDISIAWRAMMRQYKLWKYELFKQGTKKIGGK